MASLVELFKPRKKVELEFNGQRIEFYIRKPNMFDDDKASKFAEKELVKLRLNSDLRESFKVDLATKTQEELAEMLAAIDDEIILERLKLEEKLKEKPKFKDVDMIRRNYDSLNEQEKKKADKILKDFEDEISKELKKLMNSKRESYASLDKEMLINRIADTLLRISELDVLTKEITKYYIYALVEDEKGNKIFKSVEEVEMLPQELLDMLTQEIGEVRMKGVELKKVSTNQDSSTSSQ